ncbi:hypothetical protein M3223_04095 [Paenibacillus pasadenensis]|uniref:hypothetical protein n=1 Tax=Paenibacillus pasadenensis TaxID=217090 RepID=UPI0020425413|nr:hypothetical protein [Paenibacillus pasadenensis]MCM3746530.1 hypothetical protein [Paenibacillus pasadenensis]
MTKRLAYPMNLQLFADDTDPEFEIDDSEDEGEVEDPYADLLEDGEDDSDGEESDEQEETEDEEEQDDSEGEADESSDEVEDEGEEADTTGGKKGPDTTGRAVIAERRKWQARMKELEKEAGIARRLMEQTGVKDFEEMNKRMDALHAQNLIQQGVPEHIAHSMALGQRQIAEMQQQLKGYKYDGEAQRLKADPFFADIEQYREEFEGIAERTGQTLESVYMAQRGRQRMKEREAEIEAKVKASKERKAQKSVSTSPTGKSASPAAKSRIQLSAAEKAVAKAAGMTPEEYAKFRKR